MKQPGKNIFFYLSIATALLLVFIGGRFLLQPLAAEIGFGIHVPVGSDYSFHYIKGIRDLSFGLILLVLLLSKEYRAAGLLMLIATIIPAVDFSIVMSHPGFETDRLYAHAIAVVLCLVLGGYYVRNTTKK